MPTHSQLPPVQSFTRPSSRMDVVAPAPASQSNPFIPTSRSVPPSERIIAPLPTKAHAPSHKIQPQPQPAPRTPSPPLEVEVGMELAVPLNDTESGKNERTSIFPTGLARKPSFSALPDPSPLRKSTRSVGGGGLERGKSVERGDRISVHATTTPGTTNTHSKERGSVRASSGWFKSKTALERTPSSAVASVHGLMTTAEKLALKSGSSLDTDEKTTLNTAKNAAIGAVGSGGVKRKSELLEKSPGKTGPERAAKSQMKDDGTFAGDLAKRLTTTTPSAAPLDAQKPTVATTSSGQRLKTLVEVTTPKNRLRLRNRVRNPLRWT
jgi:hypothetical protein